MRRRTATMIAALMLVTVSLAHGSFADTSTDEEDPFVLATTDPPDRVEHVQVRALPGQPVVLDVHVPTMTMSAQAGSLADVLDNPPPRPGDVTCTNTWSQVLGIFMAPATASVALPGLAASFGGSGCSFEPVEITDTMEHVRVVSTGSHQGGVQAYHGDAYGLFTVWCGGTLGYTDRAPEDGDWYWEEAGDLTEEPDPTLVNCYAITRGDVHPSEWTSWAMMSLNWHEHAGVVDARVSLS